MPSMRKSMKGDKSETMGDKVFKGVGDLIKLLPSGTVFLFQFLSPLLTNNGHCHTFNRYLSGALLLACSFSCCFSCFTDSYIGNNNKLYYGIVTKNGLWSFSDPDASKKDLSKYKLRLGDFAHALTSLLVFAVIAMLDSNTASCFYPQLESNQKTVMMVMPTVVGGLASSVFVLFPSDRHGIGYPAATEDAEES